MMSGIARFAMLPALLAFCFAASGCIDSSYDVSLNLKPEFPIREGAYKNTKKPAESVSIYRTGVDWYWVLQQPEQPEKPYIRLFRIPEFEGFLVQAFVNPGRQYGYFFVEISGDTLQEQLIADYDSLPKHIRSMIRVRDTTKVIEVTYAARDTLYVLRELAKSRALKPNNRYELVVY